MEIREPGEDELEQLAHVPSAASFLENRFLVAWSGREIASFLAWRAVSPDEFEILQIETISPFRRKGFAGLLLQAFIRQSRGIIFLEVRESNAAARQIYEKAGFVEIGRRRGYYSDPLEDAIVLKFRSC